MSIPTIKVTNTKPIETAQAKAVADYEPSQAVRDLLARHGVSIYPPNTSVGDKAVRWEGRGYVLPADPREVDLEEAGKSLLAKAEEEKQTIRVYETVDAMPWDGAQAFAKAIEDLFGWGISRPLPGLFGPNPPITKSIQTGPEPTDSIQIMWGGIEIPQLGCVLNTQVDVLDNRLVFAIGGTIQKGKRHYLEMLVGLTRIYARERSIYKNKAIRMFVDEGGNIDFEREPEFLKLDSKTLDELVFTKTTAAQIETNLFTPIKYSSICRDMGIPLKRGILLEGPYGTGKSMTARATAYLAIKNGWTFIMINRAAGLQSVLDFAHRYAPVVVFAEDIDRIVSGEERTVSIDDILNTLDGVQSKSHDVITVLTSNHVSKISRAMLRPGRLDAIVSVELPDADAAERLMRMYSAGMIDDATDLTHARDELSGCIPAVIREAVERAKLSAIARTGGVPTSLTDDDLCVAAATMRTHLDLLYADDSGKKSPADLLWDALRDMLSEGINKEGGKFAMLEAWARTAAQQSANTTDTLRGLAGPIKDTHQRVVAAEAKQAQQKN